MLAQESRTRKPETHGTCRLTLTLTVRGEATDYTLTAVPVTKLQFGLVRSFRLRKAGAAVYEVGQWLDGSLTCTCPDSQYGADGHHCKHARAIAGWQVAGILASGPVSRPAGDPCRCGHDTTQEVTVSPQTPPAPEPTPTPPAAPEPVQAVPAADYAAILALLRAGKESGLKRPSVEIRTRDGGRVVLKLNGDKSRYPGSVAVSNGGAFGSPDNLYFGRIDEWGRLMPVAGIPAGVVESLDRFAADPVAVASLIGRETGRCVFCGLELTDERSVSVGFGPVCAKKYSLPWTPKEVAALVQRATGLDWRPAEMLPEDFRA